MSTDAQKRASTNYNRKQDNIMIRPSKEEGQQFAPPPPLLVSLYRGMY